jgi:DNA-directed RNA polymerase alpha subunit
MRLKNDIQQDITNATSIEAQVRLNNELLLDIREMLCTLMPDGFQTLTKQREQTDQTAETTKEADPNDPHVMEMPLSARVKKILRTYNINYLSDIEQKTAENLLMMRNFGDNCLVELREVVATYGKSIDDY